MRQMSVMDSVCRGGLIAAAVIAVALLGCGSGGGGGGGGTPTPPNPPGTRTLQGVVRDGNGQPLAGVTVSAAGVTATTGADGSWSLTGLPATGSVNVTFTATGFSAQTVVVTDETQTTVGPIVLAPVGLGDISQPPPPPNFDQT